MQLDARLQFDADDSTLSMVLEISTDDLHFRQLDGQSFAAVDLAIEEQIVECAIPHAAQSARDSLSPGEYAEIGVVDISHRWELKPGAATIRLIVRDRLTNRYGTLDVPVKDIPHAAPKESAQ